MNPVFLWADHLRDWARRRRRGGNQAHALGRRGEDAAHRHLQRTGMVVVARNYRTPGGSAEIDLVALDGPTLVFVEVKTRETDEFGAPDRAIDRLKRDKIRRAASNYLHRAGHDRERIRFDVVSVVMQPALRIEHVKDAWGS